LFVPNVSHLTGIDDDGDDNTMTIREDVFKLVHTEDIHNPDLVWHTYPDERIEKILELFTKLIDKRILEYTSGKHTVFDEIERVKELEELKEELKK
jgi:hypothetical protein